MPFRARVRVLDREVDDKETGRYGDRLRKGLDGHVLQFDSDRVGDLRKVLPGDRDPLLPILHEEVPAPGETREVLAEELREFVVPG